MANIYEGKFPVKDTGEDGFAGIAPVAQFPAEWLRALRHGGQCLAVVQRLVSAGYLCAAEARRGVVARNPQGPDSSYDPGDDQDPKRVHRGGSFLCTDQYCTRYMVGTRGKGDIDTGTNHLGFRCVRSNP